MNVCKCEWMCVKAYECVSEFLNVCCVKAYECVSRFLNVCSSVWICNKHLCVNVCANVNVRVQMCVSVSVECKCVWGSRGSGARVLT